MRRISRWFSGSLLSDDLGQQQVVLMPVEVGVVLIGAGFAVGVSLAVAVWFERWKAKQPDPEGK